MSTSIFFPWMVETMGTWLLISMMIMISSALRQFPKPGLRFVRSKILSSTSFFAATSWKSISVSNDESKTLLLKDAYRSIVAYLDENQVPESDISARTFLCDVTKIGYRLSDFNRHQDLQLTFAQIQTLTEFCKLRIERMPVQYVIGNWDFYGLTILCKPPVLCPRPETEELVERILSTNMLQKLGRPARILDVGAGTGVIGLALLSQLPTATCDALDINPIAVDLSNTNAKLILGTNDTRYTCHHQSFMDFVTSDQYAGQYDLIVSNPPYIPTEELAGLEPEVRQYEDQGALDGGTDGLDMIRDLILHSSSLLRPRSQKNPTATSTNNITITAIEQEAVVCGELWLEVARQHPVQIQTMMDSSNSTTAQSYPWSDRFLFVESIVDFAGNPRFVRLRLS